MSPSSYEIEKIVETVLRVIDERSSRPPTKRRTAFWEWIKANSTILFATFAFIAVVAIARVGYHVHFGTILSEVSRDYTQAQERHDLVEQHIELGRDFHAVERVSAARAEFKQALLLEPTDLEVQHNLFITNTFEPVERGTFDLAVVSRKLDFLSEQDPSDPILHAMRGDLYYVEKNYDKALNAYRKAVDPDTDDLIARAFNGEAAVLALRGNALEALKAYKHAVKLAPDNPSYVANLADELGSLGHLRRAIKRYKQLHLLNGTYILSYLASARLLRKEGRLGQAIDEQKKAIVLLLNRRTAEAELNDGIWFFTLGARPAEDEEQKEPEPEPAPIETSPTQSGPLESESGASQTYPYFIPLPGSVAGPNEPPIFMRSKRKKLCYSYHELALTSYMRGEANSARLYLRKANKLSLFRPDTRDVRRVVRNEILELKKSSKPKLPHGRLNAFLALLH